MGEIEELLNIDFKGIVLGVFITAFAIKEILEIHSFFKKRYGFKTGSELDQETLMKRLKELEKNDAKKSQEIGKISKGIDDIVKKLDENNKRAIDWQISNIRWEILDFASSLLAKRRFSKEQFEHVLSIHEDYKRLLEKAGQENGQVTASIEVIKERYKWCLTHGFNAAKDEN